MRNGFHKFMVAKQASGLAKLTGFLAELGKYPKKTQRRLHPLAP